MKGSSDAAALQLNERAKSELMVLTREVMPAGEPAFPEIRRRAPMVKLIDCYGPATMHKVLMMLIRDLCQSINVVRPMTTAQISEAAGFLLDECGDFRLEDFVVMFTMAKRGRLAINGDKGFMDRVDIETIGKVMDAYYEIRRDAGYAAQEAEMRKAEEEWRMGTRGVMHDQIVDLTQSEAVKKTNWRELLQDDKAEQEKRDRELRERRDREVENFNRLMAVPRFAQRIIDGEAITSAEDIQFYTNHAEEIERSIKAIEATLKSPKRKSDYPDPYAFRIKTADPSTPPPSLNPERKE